MSRRVLLVGSLLPRTCPEFGTHLEGRIRMGIETARGPRQLSVRHIYSHDTPREFPLSQLFAALGTVIGVHR